MTTAQNCSEQEPKLGEKHAASVLPEEKECVKLGEKTTTLKPCQRQETCNSVSKSFVLVLSALLQKRCSCGVDRICFPFVRSVIRGAMLN